MGLLAGRVVLITGAGNGIGRAHALACAREGARVVVNDLGGARDGTGADGSAAASVVREIEALGGEAVANTDSVTDAAGCARMVAAAVEKWGRLDAVVNNAGILRDGTFRKMTDEQWRLVIDVHLNGTQNVTRAALPALLGNDGGAGGGAIINTTSYSGLIGNFGQSNYGAAKAGVYGFTRVLALELRRSNITVNCLAPIAKTRMTEEIGMVEAEWTPEQISPVVVFLASELGKVVTGKVFGVQGQRIHAYEMKANDGVEKAGSEPWTAPEIAQHLDRIFAFELGAPASAPLSPPPAQAAPAMSAAPAAPDPVSEAFSFVPQAYKADKAKDWAAVIHFKIAGGPDKTIICGEGKARAEDGLHGTPTCTFKTDRETIIGILTQQIDAQKAFMKNKISADDLGVAMKFAMFFRFEKPAAPAAAAAAPTPAAPTPAAAAHAVEAISAPPPKAWAPPIGKTYQAGYFLVKPADAEAYAAATNDPSLAYYGEGAIVPPMFHVRLLRDAMFAVILDPELDLDVLRLVHGEHDATFHRPLKAWDLVQCRATLEGVEQKAKGLLVTVRLTGIVNGEVSVEARSLFFIRGQIKLPLPAGKGSPEEKVDLGEPSHTRTIEVSADQSYRYAKVSLDDNPIHTDAATAQAAGLPDVILHGLCTMALSGVGVLRAIAFDDATRLKRLGVRFSKPVLNGSALRLRIWRQPNGARFDVLDAQGEAVITNGVAELS